MTHPRRERCRTSSIMIFLLLVMATGYSVTAGRATALPTSTDAGSWAASMLSTMNAERVAAGLRPLHSRGALVDIARTHSRKMGTYNTVSHQLPTEGSTAERLTSAGYATRPGGENLAQTSDLSSRGAQALERAMSTETSPTDGRRENLRNPSFHYVGIALTIDSAHHKMWVTQDFSASPAPRPLPARVTGGYWPYYRSGGHGAYPLHAVPSDYNVLYLFSARPVGGTPGTNGSIFFSQNHESADQLRNDVVAARAAGRRVVLTVGGAGEFIALTTTARRDAFLASFRAIVATQLGGVIDGLDWDLEGGTYATANMVYISHRLKTVYGTNFSITFAAAPYRLADKNLAQALLAGGALDFVAPQYYDLVGLTDDASQITNLRARTVEWARLVGASRVGLGLKNTPANNTSTMAPSSCVTAWKSAQSQFPALRGVFVWNLYIDHFQNADRFSSVVVPAVRGQ